MELCICRLLTQAGLEQDCWRVLNRCIQHVEVASERDNAVNAAAERVMDSLIQQVTLHHASHAISDYDLWAHRCEV